MFISFYPSSFYSAKLFRSFLLTAFFLFPVSNISAQDNLFEKSNESDVSVSKKGGRPIPTISERMLETIAKQLGVPRDSKFYKNFMNANFIQSQNSSNEFVSPQLMLEPKTFKPFRHLRSNKGIALPKKEEIPKPVVPRIALNSKMPEFQAKAENNLLARNTKVKELPNCNADKTEKIDLNNPNTDSESNKLLYDMVFLRKESAPIDAEEVLGQRAVVIKYTSARPNTMSLATVGIQIPCLPYRIRGTKRFIYKDQGLNAVKDYQDNQDGPGILHEIMQKKIKG